MIYRWLLHCYPYAFRQLHQDELEADFDALCAEARQQGGRLAVIRCHLESLADLALSLPREWLRTPWLAALVAAGAVASLIFYYAVGRVYRARAFYSETQPPESPALILLLAIVVIVPASVMALIGLALGVGILRPRERRRRA